MVTDAHTLTADQMKELLSTIKKYKGRVLLVGSSDFLQEQKTAFDHVAYRVSRNDKLQKRQDYYTVALKKNEQLENERTRS